MSLQALTRLTRANTSKKIHPGKLINLNPGFQCPHIMTSKSHNEIWHDNESDLWQVWQVWQVSWDRWAGTGTHDIIDSSTDTSYMYVWTPLHSQSYVKRNLFSRYTHKTRASEVNSVNINVQRAITLMTWYIISSWIRTSIAPKWKYFWNFVIMTCGVNFWCTCPQRLKVLM